MHGSTGLGSPSPVVSAVVIVTDGRRRRLQHLKSSLTQLLGHCILITLWLPITSRGILTPMQRNKRHSSTPQFCVTISSASYFSWFLVCAAPGLWAVVNNAGIAFPAAPPDWLTIEDYKPMLAVNLCGVINVTLSVLPLIKKCRGRVVNVASVFGRVSPFSGPYCITKYGVEAFNDSLR